MSLPLPHKRTTAAQRRQMRQEGKAAKLAYDQAMAAKRAKWNADYARRMQDPAKRAQRRLACRAAGKRYYERMRQFPGWVEARKVRQFEAARHRRKERERQQRIGQAPETLEHLILEAMALQQRLLTDEAGED